MCGIAAYTGNTPPNISSMKILGMYNIARGDDSCGISVDNQVTKGVGKNSNWVDFQENNHIPTPEITNSVILHTRKATGGKHTEENAHPFTFHRNNNTKTPYFIGCHNGTINNENELIAKYKMNHFKYEVDSQLLLKVISTATKKNKTPLNILNDYEGNAALVFYWTSEVNTLYVWKGATFKHTIAVEERPLFYWFTGTGYYISSIKESLLAIGGTTTEVKSFDNNVLYKITEDVMEILPITFTRGIKPTAVPQTTIVTPKVISTTNKIHTMENTFINYTHPNIPKHETTITRGDDGRILLINEPAFDYDLLLGGRIYFWRGRYYRNGHKLNNKNGDIFLLDSKGYPEHHIKVTKSELKKYYFYNGLKLKDEKALNTLLYLIDSDRVKYNSESDLYLGESLALLNEIIEGIVVSMCDTRGFIKTYNNDGGLPGFATGKITPMFALADYYFDYGVFHRAEKHTSQLIIPFVPSKSVKEEDIEEDTIIAIPNTENFDDEINNYIDIMDAVEDTKKSFLLKKDTKLQKLGRVLAQTYFYLEEHFKNVASENEEFEVADLNDKLY